jgi:hypothetical protein
MSLSWDEEGLMSEHELEIYWRDDIIKRLAAFKKEALEVISFYGSESNWDGKGESIFTVPDQENYTEVYYPTHGEPELELIGIIGGKRARDFLKKHEVKE